MKQKSKPGKILKKLHLSMNGKRAAGAVALLCFTVLLVGIPAITGHIARYVDSDTDLAAVYRGKTAKINKSDERRHMLVIAVDELTGAVAPQEVQVRGDRIMCDLIYEPLGKLQTNGVIQPVLADRINVTADGSAMEIVLRDNVLFSDGTKMIADHVIGSVAAMLQSSEEGSPYRNIAGADEFLRDNTSGLSGVQALDEKSIRITFTQATSQNLQLLDTRVQKLTLDELGSGGMTIGTGPYCIGEAPDNMQLVQNAKFRKRFGDIETIQFVYTSQYDLTGYLEKGQVDVFMYSGGTKAYDQIAKYPTHNMYEKPTDEVYYFGFNRHNPWNEKKEFRQAVAYAFNRDGLVSDQMFPYISENKTLSLATDQYSKKSKDTVLEYDPKKAKKLLEQVNPDKKEISLRLPVLETSIIQTTAAEAFRKDMEHVGIKVEVQPMKQDQYIETLYYSGEFDVCMTTMRIPMEFSGMNELTGDINALPIGWEDTEFYEALNALDTCYDTEEYAEKLTELNRIANQGVPILPYGRGKMFLSVSADLSGYQANPYSSLIDDVWKIKAKK